MPLENSTAISPPFERGQLPLDDALARVAVAAVFFARLLLLDEVDHRLRVGERVRRRAEDRIGDRVARLLPRLAAVNAERRELRRPRFAGLAGGSVASSCGLVMCVVLIL